MSFFLFVVAANVVGTVIGGLLLFGIARIFDPMF